MVQSPEDCTLAVFYDSVPHFKIHSQHQSARLHYLLKNKLKQLCFMIYLKNYSHLKIQATQNIMLMTLLLWQAGPDFGSQEMCVCMC